MSISKIKFYIKNYFYYIIKFEYWRPKINYSLSKIIEKYSIAKKDFFFIQIGANDGGNYKINNQSFDPINKLIKKYDWAGLLIEPLKSVFNNYLKPLYNNNSKIRLENVAISDSIGQRKLYKISFSESRWATGLSSFIKEVIEKHIDSGRVALKAKEEDILMPSNKNEYITHEIVECVTLDYLINKYNIKKIDLLLIDTEGFDYEIIKLVNFDKIKPNLIYFEHKHLSTSDYKSSLMFLKIKGYKLQSKSGNTLAILS